MRRSVRFGLLLAVVCLCVAPPSFSQDADPGAEERLADAINAIDFGVPSTPAFELLPDRPGEVVHILTARDFQSNIAMIFDGNQVRPAFAFDARPFVGMGGTLVDYNESFGRRLAWRTVMSIGSAAAPDRTEDALLSVGFRVPLIDHGDPRASMTHINGLESAYIDAMDTQPRFDESLGAYTRRLAEASVRADSIRNDFHNMKWNALKLDVGFAGMFRLRDRRLDKENFFNDRAGFWLASGLPLLGTAGQLMMSAKLSWSRADSAAAESSRQVVGARARIFVTESMESSADKI